MKDSITIYYAYRKGIVDGEERFGALQSIDGVYISDRSGTGDEDSFGTDRNYDIRLLIPQCEKTRYFDLYTKIWIYSTPKSNAEQADYRVTAEPYARDGQLYVFCESIAVNNRELYYLDGDEIITVSVKLNENLGKFYTRTNMYLPIDKRTKIWMTEPDDKDSDEDLIAIKSKRITKRYNEYTYVRQNG